MKRPFSQAFLSFKSDDSGAVIVFWAVSLGVFMGLLALSFDFGRAASTQSELQSYADNVALAAAGELNGQSDSIVRATLAAQTMISDTQTFGDGDVVLSDDGDYQIAFFSSPPTPNASGMATTDPIEAGYVQVTATEQNVSAVFGNAFATLTGEGSGEGAVSAIAVAGFTQYACDVTPLMFCAPSVDFRAADNVGNTILLRTGGNNAGWIPGSFGWANPAGAIEVDQDGICAGLNGAKLDICLISAVGNRSTCLSQSGVDLAGGQRVGSFEAAINIRFDIYHASTNNLRNNPAYPPAPNVLHSWEPATGQCIGNTGVLATAKIGLPSDDCHGAGTCDRFGDGDWSEGRKLYVDINYGGNDPFPSAVTRYDYYLAEIEATASVPGGPGGLGGLLGGLKDEILPQCSNNVSDDPGRRVIVAASIDCLNLTLQTGERDIKVIEFVELFLTAPVGLDGSKDIWVEVIAGVGGGSGGSDEEAHFREVVQLYK